VHDALAETDHRIADLILKQIGERPAGRTRGELAGTDDGDVRAAVRADGYGVT
jgi:hypothetical protein